MVVLGGLATAIVNTKLEGGHGVAPFPVLQWLRCGSATGYVQSADGALHAVQAGVIRGLVLLCDMQSGLWWLKQSVVNLVKSVGQLMIRFELPSQCILLGAAGRFQLNPACSSPVITVWLPGGSHVEAVDLNV